MVVIVVLSNCEKHRQEKTDLAKNDFVEDLFQGVSARESDPEKLPPSRYDDIKKKAISYKILNKYPNLNVGKISFLPEMPEELIAHTKEIEEGQGLILNDVLGSDMQDKPFTFKALIDQINSQHRALRDKLQYTDWVLIASAFRTLSGPDAQDKVNPLGVFVAEYIVIMLINDLEKNTNKTSEESQTLSSLYYILSQIYQDIANNPEQYSFVQSQKSGKNSSMYLSLPKSTYSGAYSAGQTIEPYNQERVEDYGVEYAAPQDYSVFVDLDESYDDLIGTRLNLLSYAVTLTPDYDLAWAPLIEFVTVDVDSPYYINRLSPVFWDNYFPGGLVAVSPFFINRMHHRWEDIRAHHPRALRAIRDPNRVSNALREMKNPAWRVNQERRAARDLQAKQRRLAPEHRITQPLPHQLPVHPNVVAPKVQPTPKVRPPITHMEHHFERPHPQAVHPVPHRPASRPHPAPQMHAPIPHPAPQRSAPLPRPIPRPPQIHSAPHVNAPSHHK